jgi:hypothetical protein
MIPDLSHLLDMGIGIDDFKLFHNLLSDDLLESLPPRYGNRHRRF